MSSSIKLALLLSLSTALACANDVDLQPGDDDGVLPDGGPVVPHPRPDGGPGIPDGGTGTGDGGLDTCGNRVIDVGEQCDDGNAISGDGCTSACQLESAMPGDICPGNEIALTQDGTYLRGTVRGTTAGAYNQYGSACGGGSGPDLVYSFTPTTSGKAVVRFGADFLGIISARPTCDVATELTCQGLNEPNTEATFEIPVFAGQPAFLHVDGYAGSAGTFDIQVDISLAACGNGAAELPEQCDDGNLVAGDGCSPTCTFEAGGVLTGCPGQPYVMQGAPGQPRSVSFTANTKTDGLASTSGDPVWFSQGANVVYAIQSDIDGSAHVELEAGGARTSVHVRRDCGTVRYQADSALAFVPGTASLDVPVHAGEWLYVFVDSQSNFGGPFVATVTVTPPTCGNGALDGGEACDDGNLVDGDGCTTTCTLQEDGDAATCVGAQIPLRSEAGTLRGTMSGTLVGKEPRVPPCDNGSYDMYGTQGGIERPSASMAGNAIYRVTPTISGRLQVQLHDTFQGVVSILSEAPCTLRVDSNGNKNGVDRLPNVLGCSYMLLTPDGFGASDPFIVKGFSGDKVASSPVVADMEYYVVVDAFGNAEYPAGEGPFTLQVEVQPPACGNGTLDAAETCDDGNTTDGDGCNATCAIEAAQPDTCATARELTLTSTGPATYAATARGNTQFLAANQEFGNGSSNAGACTAPGPDAYYKIRAPAGGVLRVTAHSDAFDVVLGLRDVCSVNTRPLACRNGGAAGSEELLVRAVEPNEELFVVVDSPSFPRTAFCVSSPPKAWCDELTPRGPFELDITLAPSSCGDGYYAAGTTEQCDDGNLVNGDGCSATCQLETLAGIDTCPGYPVSLAQTPTGYQGTVAVNTAGLTANYSGACGGSGRDGVLRIVAPMSGTLRATATNFAGVTLHARAICTDASTEFPKVSSSGTTCPNVVHDSVTFQVTQTDEYFVFVDGLTGESGVPTVEVTVTP